MPPELENYPEIPGAIVYLWEWFIEILWSGEINYQEIQAWQNVTGRKLRQFEVNAIKDLYALYMRISHGGN